MQEGLDGWGRSVGGECWVGLVCLEGGRVVLVVVVVMAVVVPLRAGGYVPSCFGDK